MFSWALISFGKSLRVGLDEDHPGELVTSGAFALSRNAIYVAFFLVLPAIFLVYPNWVFLVYLLAATLLFNRQVVLEETSLRKVYGTECETYCGAPVSLDYTLIQNRFFSTETIDGDAERDP